MGVVTNSSINGQGLSREVAWGCPGSNGANLFDPSFCHSQTQLADSKQWRSNLDTQSFITNYATTDGAIYGKWFTNLTNSGTATLTGSQAGYEGEVLSTTGAASGNTNSWLGTDAGLPVANRVFWITQDIYLPIQSATTLYDIWLGWTDKPGTASPPSTVTDGAWITILNNAATSMTLAGNMASNSTAVTTTNTVAIPAATSIGLGVVFQAGVGADFYYRLPVTAPTFTASDNPGWTLLGSLTAATSLPRSTIVLRPYMAHITRYAATHALTMESAFYGMQRQNYR